MNEDTGEEQEHKKKKKEYLYDKARGGEGVNCQHRGITKQASGRFIVRGLDRTGSAKQQGAEAGGRGQYVKHVLSKRPYRTQKTKWMICARISRTTRRGMMIIMEVRWTSCLLKCTKAFWCRMQLHCRWHHNHHLCFYQQPSTRIYGHALLYCIHPGTKCICI